ncbi:FKBP-type peptidyl-prolyl cis-trans isomerase [Candidatus Woesearchaeota archaeon]|nr:FKBP-type peptidyl-prolyl cis-trans isomerase [Candidatus Woesearchaeota archaeon]
MKKILLLLLLVACGLAPPDAGMTVPADNTTSVDTGVQKGDLVTVNFELTLENGTVADTNNPALAEQNGVKNYVKGPYAFILGQSGKVKGFDDAIIGMKLGEKREVNIKPSEPEIILNLNKTIIRNRLVTIPRLQAFPLGTFKERFGKQAIIGDVVFSNDFPFKYQIVNMTNKSAIGKMLLKEGEEYVLPNTEWKSEVAKVTEEDAMFYSEPQDNQTISSPFGNATVTFSKSRLYIIFHPELGRIFNYTAEVNENGIGIPMTFQVVKIHDAGFTIKRYGSLADKNLKLNVELLEVTEDVKEVRESRSRVKTSVA